MENLNYKDQIDNIFSDYCQKIQCYTYGIEDNIEDNDSKARLREESKEEEFCTHLKAIIC